VALTKAAEQEEPSIQAKPSYVETRLNRGLERIASVLTSGVAVLLVGYVVVALVGVVVAGLEPLLRDGNLTEAAVHGVDASFLAIILLELVHTTVSRGAITRQVQEFLVIGITAGVRSGLEVAASAREHAAREVAVNLAINSFAVLLLVVALCAVRWRLHAEHTEYSEHAAAKEHADAKARAEGA
jgi:hypothetical protein